MKFITIFAICDAQFVAREFWGSIDPKTIFNSNENVKVYPHLCGLKYRSIPSTILSCEAKPPIEKCSELQRELFSALRYVLQNDLKFISNKSLGFVPRFFHSLPLYSWLGFFSPCLSFLLWPMFHMHRKTHMCNQPFWLPES